MLNLSQYLAEATAEKDRHLTHIEDAVLEGGVTGTRNAIQFLIALRDMFADDGKVLSEAVGRSLILRTKFDGAPALYAGINPENGRFFVGSKSIFAKNAKLNYTVADIRANHQGGLADKLETALKYLPELGIKGIVHGDFMFSQNELKKERIDGKDYITFRPNTITYAVPVGSKTAKQIEAAKMGIVFHTTYHGDTMQSLKTHFDADISHFRKTKDVWYRENRFVDVTGRATLTPAENAKLSSILSSAGALFRKIPSSVLNEISVNEAYRIPIMTFHNQKVRAGEHLGPGHTNQLIKFVSDKYNAKVLEAKMAATKQKRLAEKNKIVGWFRRNATYLKMIFDLQNLFIDAKMLLISKFNQAQDLGTFLQTSNGFRVTNHEGFVAAWSTGGDAVKLVDRLEFSRANFLATKNWGKNA